MFTFETLSDRDLVRELGYCYDELKRRNYDGECAELLKEKCYVIMRTLIDRLDIE